MGLNECAFLLMSCVNLVKPLEKAPTLDFKEIRRYNMAINRSAQKYDISPFLLLALFKRESQLGLHTGRSATNDYGPMQINISNIERFKLSIAYVTTTEGAMDTAARLLAATRESADASGCWWSRYNSSKPHFRADYEKLVKDGMRELGYNVTCSKRENFLWSYNTASQFAEAVRKLERKRDVALRVSYLTPY